MKKQWLEKPPFDDFQKSLTTYLHYDNVEERIKREIDDYVESIIVHNDGGLTGRDFLGNYIEKRGLAEKNA